MTVAEMKVQAYDISRQLVFLQQQLQQLNAEIARAEQEDQHENKGE